MKTILTGSKRMKYRPVLEQAIQESGFEISEVLTCGGYGVDRVAREWADENGRTVTEFKADWSDLNAEEVLVRRGRDGRKYNALAGKSRARKMLEYADAAILICETQEDAKDLWTLADEYGVQTYIHAFDEDESKKAADEFDLADSSEWARQIRENRNAVVLDTESTGGSDKDEVISIGIVRLHDGEILLDTKIKPTEDAKFNYYASLVHGLTKEMLADSPTFAEVWGSIEPLLMDNDVLAYNYSSDFRMLAQSASKYGLVLPNIRWHCIMKQYKRYSNRSSNTNLTTACEEMSVKAGNHDALDDALAAARIVFRMAQNYKKSLTNE